jgi:D-alanyl-lipoteichoic acid acyltransferase DltB (MBOAT superfamily)
LIGASAAFYCWWDIRFVFQPISQVAMTWVMALLHERTGRRSLLTAGIVLNLLSLGAFKYLNFVLESVEIVFNVTLPSCAHEHLLFLRSS